MRGRGRTFGQQRSAGCMARHAFYFFFFSLSNNLLRELQTVSGSFTFLHIPTPACSYWSIGRISIKIMWILEGRSVASKLLSCSNDVQDNFLSLCIPALFLLNRIGLLILCNHALYTASSWADLVRTWNLYAFYRVYKGKWTINDALLQLYVVVWFILITFKISTKAKM